MDIAITPPLRVQPTSSLHVSSKAVQAQVDQFLSDFQTRHTLARTQGDATIYAQLQKLTGALKQERRMKK